MSARILILALATLMPSLFGAAASPLASPGSSEGKPSTPAQEVGTPDATAAAPAEGTDAARPKATKARPTQEKKATAGKATISLESLRKDCYGGVGPPVSPLVLDVRNSDLREAIRLQDARWTAVASRDLLQVGVEDHPLLEVYRQALEALGDPESLEAAKACVDLIRVLYPPDGP